MNFIYKIVICTVLFCFFFIRPAENVPIVLNEPLCQAMQAAGAELDKAYLTGSIKFSGDCELSELAKLLKLIGSDLGNHDNAVELQTSDYQELAYLSFNKANLQYVLYAKAIKSADNKENNIELTLRTIIDEPIEKDIIKQRDIMAAILHKKAAEPLIYTCLEGYLDGKLRKGERESCIRDAFAAIAAKTITQIDNPQYASLTGCSPLLNNSLQVGKDFMNINIAARYHDFDRRTYITIGSPIINIEY